MYLIQGTGIGYLFRKIQSQAWSENESDYHNYHHTGRCFVEAISIIPEFTLHRNRPCHYLTGLATIWLGVNAI